MRELREKINGSDAKEASEKMRAYLENKQRKKDEAMARKFGRLPLKRSEVGSGATGVEAAAAAAVAAGFRNPSPASSALAAGLGLLPPTIRGGQLQQSPQRQNGGMGGRQLGGGASSARRGGGGRGAGGGGRGGAGGGRGGRGGAGRVGGGGLTELPSLASGGGGGGGSGGGYRSPSWDVVVRDSPVSGGGGGMRSPRGSMSSPRGHGSPPSNASLHRSRGGGGGGGGGGGLSFANMAADYEHIALRAVQRREEVVAVLLESAVAMMDGEGTGGGAARGGGGIRSLPGARAAVARDMPATWEMCRKATVEAVEAIVAWRRNNGSSAAPFVWNGEDYLSRVGADLYFLRNVPGAMDAIGFAPGEPLDPFFHPAGGRGSEAGAVIRIHSLLVYSPLDCPSTGIEEALNWRCIYAARVTVFS